MENPVLTCCPFRPEDLDAIDFRGVERRLLAGAGDWDAYRSALANCWRPQTGWVDGVPVGCAGILGRHGGVGEAWVLLSESLPIDISTGREARLWALLTAAVRQNLRAALDGPFHRIEAHVRVDFPAAVRWIEHIGGFVFEAPEIAYGTDRSDYFRFARISPSVFQERSAP